MNRDSREKAMAERNSHKLERKQWQMMLFHITSLLMILLLLVGCSNAGEQSGTILNTGKGGRQLPPAWTPTPISIPGTGLDAGTWKPCDDGPPSQLEIGDSAVFEGTSFKLRLRGEPGIEGTLKGDINPGERIDIINGPACFDKLVWWEIQSATSGNSGWAAEGNDYDTWLVRVD